MLEEIRIKGLGVIDEALLAFGPGFTAVTGETGAGKTMVLTALGLLLGGRADPGLVRVGGTRAVVEGRLRVDPDGPAALRANEAGAELDEDALILGRTVFAEARSRAHLGGRSVPATVLTELGTQLVAVHGQSDQQRLLQPALQRQALDRFAGAAVSVPLTEYATSYARLRTVSSTLAEITTRARERAQEADLLRFGLQEIEVVDPQPGEDEALVSEAGRLGHADALRDAAGTAQAALSGDESTGAESVDVLSGLAAARRALESVRSHDSELAGLADRLAEASYLVSDVAADLGSYTAGVDTDPARLQTVQERRAALAALSRKYGDGVAQVLAWAQQSAQRLGELEGDDERIGELQAERDELQQRLAVLAATLTSARGQAANRLGTAVAAELAALAMPHARVEVAVRQQEAGPAGGAHGVAGLQVGERCLEFGPTGVDEVEILLSPHHGAAPRALGRGASGGELSRVMLAIEVVFAGTDPVPTFVFDEVDAGVGGSAAVEIGRRLSLLARSAQVVVVTHLPQVAAFADHHLRVAKTDDGRITTSGVTTLDDSGRVRELSRMLAGLEGSATAQAHAEELLQTASAAKRADRDG